MCIVNVFIKKIFCNEQCFCEIRLKGQKNGLFWHLKLSLKYSFINTYIRFSACPLLFLSFVFKSIKIPSKALLACAKSILFLPI